DNDLRPQHLQVLRRLPADARRAGRSREGEAAGRAAEELRESWKRGGVEVETSAAPAASEEDDVKESRKRLYGGALIAAMGVIAAMACKPQATSETAVPAAGTKPAAKEGYVLPQSAAPFKGTIGQTYKDSKPDKIPIVQAPAGAPNVLLVLIDDSGFGTWSTFGGQI